MNPTVKCSVNTCTHYLFGDRCGAGNIDVMHENEVAMSEMAEQTMCKTFHHAKNIFDYLGSADNMNVGGTLMGVLDPEYQTSPTVTCTVASCKYWGEGSVCSAQTIQIHFPGSNECQDTDCVTFERRA